MVSLKLKLFKDRVKEGTCYAQAILTGLVDRRVIESWEETSFEEDADGGMDAYVTAGKKRFHIQFKWREKYGDFIVMRSRLGNSSDKHPGITLGRDELEMLSGNNKYHFNGYWTKNENDDTITMYHVGCLSTIRLKQLCDELWGQWASSTSFLDPKDNTWKDSHPPHTWTQSKIDEWVAQETAIVKLFSCDIGEVFFQKNANEGYGKFLFYVRRDFAPTIHFSVKESLSIADKYAHFRSVYKPRKRENT